MRKKRLESKIAQFGYDHPNFSGRLRRLRKSAGELSKMLDNLSVKGKEKREEKENEKK